jgi:hypothetical protein
VKTWERISAKTGAILGILGILSALVAAVKTVDAYFEKFETTAAHNADMERARLAEESQHRLLAYEIAEAVAEKIEKMHGHGKRRDGP